LCCVDVEDSTFVAQDVYDCVADDRLETGMLIEKIHDNDVKGFIRLAVVADILSYHNERTAVAAILPRRFTVAPDVPERYIRAGFIGAYGVVTDKKVVAMDFLDGVAGVNLRFEVH
jgi:hypothetical protein